MYREDGTRRTVYNEGNATYLFDASAAEIVEAALAASETKGAEPERLLEFATTGTLVMYELWQDDAIDVEVALGDPLTAAEKQPARWIAGINCQRFQSESNRFCRPPAHQRF